VKPAPAKTKATAKSGAASVKVAEIDPAEKYKMIELEAYFLAEKRHFQPGFEAEDWATASAIVTARLQGG